MSNKSHTSSIISLKLQVYVDYCQTLQFHGASPGRRGAGGKRRRSRVGGGRADGRGGAAVNRDESATPLLLPRDAADDSSVSVRFISCLCVLLTFDHVYPWFSFSYKLFFLIWYEYSSAHPHFLLHSMSYLSCL